MKMKMIAAMMGMGLCAGLFATGPVKADPPDPAYETVMPAVEISNQPLEKVLEQIRAKTPWFKYVIFREAGTAADYPKLPNMTVDGVTIEQFLELIKSQYVGVDIKSIEGSKQPLYHITIFDPANKHGATSQPTTQSVTSPMGVYVFRLSDIIDYRTTMTGDGDHAKQAMNDVLSAIQTALDMDSAVVSTKAAEKPEMKLHAATQTLICKLTEPQAKLVEVLLESLRPTQQQQADTVNLYGQQFTKLQSENQQLRNEIAALKEPAKQEKK